MPVIILLLLYIAGVHWAFWLLAIILLIVRFFVLRAADKVRKDRVNDLQNRLIDIQTRLTAAGMLAP